MSMKKLAGLTLVGALAFGGIAQQAQARPQYSKAFATLYAANTAAVEAKCKVCHGDDKKVRNDYGMAVGKQLGEPKVMDVDKINAALKKTEEQKSSVEGKTYGDLLKAGMLPAKQ